MQYKTVFQEFIRNRIEENKEIRLSEVIDSCEGLFIETTSVDRLEDFKNLWKGRFKNAYQLLKEKISKDEGSKDVDLDVTESVWVDLYSKAATREDQLNESVADIDRRKVTSTLEDFKETLDLLYSFKHHYVNLKNPIKLAQNRESRNKSLEKYRSLVDPPQLQPEPQTSFTPVKKQKFNHPFTTTNPDSF